MPQFLKPTCNIEAGTYNSTPLNIVLTNPNYIIDDSIDPTWSTKSSMPTARASMMSSVVDGIIYVIGGVFGANVLTVNEAYNPLTNTWETKAPMPTARQLGSASVVDGIIYVMGGMYPVSQTQNENLNKNEAYNPLTNTWETKAPMPFLLSAGTSVELDKSIFYISGFAGGISTSYNLKYNTLTNAWETKASIPTARYGCVSKQKNSKIYLIGGYTDAGVTGANECYDVLTNTWETKAPMPTARGYLSLGQIGSYLYCFGGVGTGILDRNERYDILTNTWETKTNLTIPVYGAIANEFDERIYLIGGTGSDGQLNNNDCFEVIFIQTKIYYTIDGTVPAVDETPTSNAIEYTAPFNLPIPANIKAVVTPVE